MGVRYLTAYVESLGAPVTVDLPALPPFSAADDGRCSNVVVLDASGVMARFLKPDEAERSIFDFQEMFERVAVDVAALRALGYEPVAFLDAAVPPAKLPLWRARRRVELGRLLKVAKALEYPPQSPSSPSSSSPPPLPNNCWVPPEGAVQHLADAYSAAGCEVHLGVADVDLEAAAFARRVRAFAVATCDSDFYLTAVSRVWHWEHFDVDHSLWRRRGDPTWWADGKEQGQEQEQDDSVVWLPPEGSPGVKGATALRPQQQRRRQKGWLRGWRPWRPFGRGGGGGGGGGGSSLQAAPLLPRIPVREIRADLLRERLLLSPRALPLLAACLGNDAIPHVSRRQLEAIFAEFPDLPPPPSGSAAVAAALLADAAGGAGGGDGGSGDGGATGGSSQPALTAPPPGSLLAPDGPGGGAPWRVVEILAHELSRQLALGIVGVGGLNNHDDAEAVAAASARAAATNPQRPATARFVAQRAIAYARTVRDAYDPSTVEVAAAAAPADASPAAASAAAKNSPRNHHPSRPLGSFRPASSGAAPCVVREVIANTGALARGGMRADDVREPPAALALRELRMRAYAGAGVWRLRELIYYPVAERPRVAVVAAAAAATTTTTMMTAGAPAASEQQNGAAVAVADEDGAVSSAATRSGGFFWNEEFEEVDVAAELAALGRAAGNGAPLPPLLPSSPEIVAASKSGESFASYAADELLRLQLITPVEADLLKRQASPRTRARLRRRARARLLGSPGDRWSGDGGAIACLRSLRVMSLLLTVHTWVGAALDNWGVPTIESVLDVRVFNELWRREVGRLEKEEQPRGAALRRRWVREGAPLLTAGEAAEGEAAAAGSWCWLPEPELEVATAGEGGGGSGKGDGDAAAA